jgi:hypothetical protein
MTPEVGSVNETITVQAGSAIVQPRSSFGEAWSMRLLTARRGKPEIIPAKFPLFCVFYVGGVF